MPGTSLWLLLLSPSYLEIIHNLQWGQCGTQMIDATWTWIGGVNNGHSLWPSMGGSTFRMAVLTLIFCSGQEGGLLRVSIPSHSASESIPWALMNTRDRAPQKLLLFFSGILLILLNVQPYMSALKFNWDVQANSLMKQELLLEI